MVVQAIVFYGLMWFFLLALGGGAQAAGLPAEVGLAQWGPGLAGLATLLLFRKDGGRLTLARADTSLLRYVVAVILPLAGGLIAYALALILQVPPAAGTLVASPLLFALWIPLGALGEEIGWRGVLHRRLDSRLNGLTSSLIVGLLWAPMHVHLFPNGAAYMALFAVLLVSYSIVIYALVADAGFSVLLATLFHLAINYTNVLFLDLINATGFMAIDAVVWAIIAAVTVFTRRERFFEKGSAAEVSHGQARNGR